MNLLKKLFGKQKQADDMPASAAPKHPENTKLIYLLDAWGDNPSEDNYRAVMNEIVAGNCFLLLPSVNDGRVSNVWHTLETGSKLVLSSVFDSDGLKVLGAFSDEPSLWEWCKQPAEYTAMAMRDLVGFCREQGIDRIVINSGRKNSFVLDRERRNITTTVIGEETEVLVGTPARPLPPHVIDRLATSFRQVHTIDEAYQYAQSMKGEMSIVLGIRMSVQSADATAALHHALNDALSDEALELPLDIMLLDDQWLQTARGIEGALFYKK